jgi:alpha-tubulin suppressor-like RCC1 family protein
MRSRYLFNGCHNPWPRTQPLDHWRLTSRLDQVLVLALVAAALGCREDDESPTAPELESSPVAAAAAAPAFTSISAGGDHTCALAPDRRAYCWGRNVEGQLGDGTSTDRLMPTAVAGGLRFLQISAGAEHTCGITTNERAFCWGSGPLGTNVGSSTTPIAVAGDRRFRNVNAGNNHTCAVTPSDIGFCWGLNNGFGQLGTGGGFSATPARIAGGLRWRRVTAGGQYTCGVTTDDRAYCWGYQVGPKPVAVEGGLRFRQVVAGGGGFTDAQGTEIDPPHACGVTTGDRAYCWGWGGEGQLGNGLRSSSTNPVAVAGSRRWRQVIAGAYHTCGVTMADVGFCWGLNQTGANGDGTTDLSTRPMRVVGGIEFKGISTGVRGGHTCALSTDDRPYCWGNNSGGQLGDGTRTRRLAPVPVAGTT